MDVNNINTKLVLFPVTFTRGGTNMLRIMAVQYSDRFEFMNTIKQELEDFSVNSVNNTA